MTDESASLAPRLTGDLMQALLRDPIDWPGVWPELKACMRLDSVLCLVDGKHVLQHLDEEGEVTRIQHVFNARLRSSTLTRGETRH